MKPEEAIVIVGGGHAAAQLCAGLAAAGQGARVHLVCDETELPYQRPPLSKAFMKSPQEAVQTLRAQAWYAEAGITLHCGDAAVALDRAHRLVRLQSGAELNFAALVLATGSSPRTLPQLRAGLANVAALRSGRTPCACVRCSRRRSTSRCSAVASSAWRSPPLRVHSARR